MEEHKIDDNITHRRMLRYFEWCDHYRASPIPECVVAFKLPSVKVLRVRSSQITPTMLLPFIEMLKFDNIICELDLSSCPVGDSGAYVIADAIPHFSKCFTVLQLADAGISSLGAIAIFRALISGTSAIQHLSLRNNKLGPECSSALASLLMRTVSLTYIDVSSIGLGSEGVRTITEALLRRAEARLAKKVRQIQRELAGDLPGIVGPVGNSANGGSGITSIENLLDHSLHPHLSRGSGWGWLFGEPAGLVVTSNSVVRTNWDMRQVPSLPTRRRKKNSVSQGHKGRDSRSQVHPSIVSPLAAAESRLGLSASKAEDETDDSPDIEIRVGGNFVREESMHALIHAVGLALALAGSVPLINRARTVSQSALVGCLIYCASAMFFFGAATLHHSLHRLDSSALDTVARTSIFVFIAGTYTPFLLTNLAHSVLGYSLLVAVWLCAVLGGFLSWLRAMPFDKGNSAKVAQELAGSQSTYDRVNALSSINASAEHISGRSGASGGAGDLSTGSSQLRYVEFSKRSQSLLLLFMGWLALLPYFLQRSCIPAGGWALLGIGGCLFTLGAVLYTRRWAGRFSQGHSSLRFLWYILVVVACVLHFCALLWHVRMPSERCIRESREHGLALLPWAESFLEGTNVTKRSSSLIPSILSSGSASHSSEAVYTGPLRPVPSFGATEQQSSGEACASGFTSPVAPSGMQTPTFTSHAEPTFCPYNEQLYAADMCREGMQSCGLPEGSQHTQEELDEAERSLGVLDVISKQSLSQLLQSFSFASQSVAEEGRRTVVEGIRELSKQAFGMELEEFLRKIK